MWYNYIDNWKNKMLLKDLINKYKWKHIYRRMKKLYPKKYSSEGYRNVLKELKTIIPVKNKKILINCSAHYDRFSDKYYTAVYGVSPKKQNRWALDFLPWKNCLGMDIHKSTVFNYSEVDIICHCLWEMTFFGFNNKDVQESIKNVLKEIKKNNNMEWNKIKNEF